MNFAESSAVEQLLKQYNFQPTPSIKTATLVIVNTCTIRQAAENRALDFIKKVIKFKKKKDLSIILTGCIANLIIGSKRSKPNKQLAQKFSGADWILASGDLDTLETLLNQLKTSTATLPIQQHQFSAYIPISTGCDNFCSYCIVPFTRGPEKSRDEKEIIKEIRQKVAQGVLEITLLGQNVNSYLLEGYKRIKFEQNKKKLPHLDSPFVQLLKKIHAIEGLKRIYFLTSHPRDMYPELIDAVAHLPKLCKYIHLPLQSGSTRILKLMNRHYTATQYLQLIRKIRKKIPGVALSTDIIVGFPGETEKDFQDTVTCMQTIGFDMAYISRYSPRMYTISEKLTDSVSQQIKKERHQILTAVLTKTALQQNTHLLGTKQEVLIAAKKGEENYLGKLQTNKEIHCLSTTPLHVGTIVPAIVTHISAWGLQGKIY